MYRHRPSTLLSHRNERGPRWKPRDTGNFTELKDGSVRWRIARESDQEDPGNEVGGGVTPGVWGAPNPFSASRHRFLCRSSTRRAGDRQALSDPCLRTHVAARSQVEPFSE